MIRSVLSSSTRLILSRSPILTSCPRKPDAFARIALQARFFNHDISKDWPLEVKHVLERRNISKPTTIQERAIPLLLNDNKDLVGIARTGSGKTLAFALPVIVKILQQRNNNSSPNVGETETASDNQSQSLDNSYRSSRNRNNPYCLVLAPTRELASQIALVFEQFRSVVSTITLVGGKRRSEQQNQLRSFNYDVYVATPGRLNDLIEQKDVNISNIKYLIIDEADRLLDMGFEPQLRQIIKTIKSPRQTMMFTATWPREVRSLASEFMGNFELLEVDSKELKANPNIKQTTDVCAPNEKVEKLIDFVKSTKQNDSSARLLVFCNQKRSVDFVTQMLTRNRFHAIAIHGDRSQNQRDYALRMFSTKNVDILVATDVAARGLDIKDVSHVVNFDLPTNISDYIHRIGRTARHDKTGTSYTLVTMRDTMLPMYIKQLKSTNSEIPESLKRLMY